MSTQSQSPTVECYGPACTETGRKWEFRDGRYCSTECELRHEGHQTLAELKYDHTRCFTCFRRLKDINPPKPDFEFTENGHGWTRDADGNFTLHYYSQEVTRSAATGFQFLTGDATKGEKNRGERVITGTICDACGQTDHTDHDPTLATSAAIDRLVTLLDANDDASVDAEKLRQGYAFTSDLPLAVGWALNDGSR
ncbi:hypothetical protein [Haloarcula sp. 1CSR25-25]|uniref:hypothetical protein n=1 Tax=Haloarcula sp. 1CSR25-25 TaxID=2862545 RepID=UPI0028957362|nr:hypothetical protein [Haloarcula sp. 1CSR25-25]MDT3434704.1 hypothetical protein [Haloarcula sp. 1CSR25-25]